jgi:hypothetical protein
MTLMKHLREFYTFLVLKFCVHVGCASAGISEVFLSFAFSWMGIGSLGWGIGICVWVD